jgi:hypothetical protein
MIRVADWILNPRFDTTFVFGLLLLGLTTGVVCLIQPALFYQILLIYLWFLGYHHVIATYTRFCFDRESLKEHRVLIWGLLPAVAVVTLVVAWQVGMWVMITGAIYWEVLRTVDWLLFVGISATLVLYHFVNFHHYMVDSMIWKVCKPRMQAPLGLEG